MPLHTEPNKIAGALSSTSPYSMQNYHQDQKNPPLGVRQFTKPGPVSTSDTQTWGSGINKLVSKI